MQTERDQRAEMDQEASTAVSHPFKRLHLNRRSALPDKKMTPVEKAAAAKSASLLSGAVFDEETLKPPSLEDEVLSSLNGAGDKRAMECSENDIDLFMETSEEYENTCLVAISVVEQAIKTSRISKREHLDAYIRTVFGVTDGRYKLLCREAARSDECCELSLTCQVKNAEGLEPKDASALNEFFCHLAILSRQHMNDPLVKQKNIFDWRIQGMVKSASTTSARRGLSPVWNEITNLPLSDVNEEMLVVEVWGRDQGSANGGKKHKSSLPTMPKKQNFIGRTFYGLRTVPMEGQEKSMALYSHSAKHQRGRVKLQLNIKGLSEETPVELSLREYKSLFKALVNNESKVGGQYLLHWKGKLCEEAETLLSQHAALKSISNLQVHCVQLPIYLEYFKAFGLDLSLLRELVEAIKTERAEMHEDEAEEPLWVKKMFHDIQETKSEMFELIRNHLTKFNWKSADDIEQITQAIRTLKEIHSFWQFLKRIEPEKRKLDSQLALCIQTAVPRWFLELTNNFSPMEICSENEMQLIAIRGLCVHCLRQCQRAQKSITAIFAEVDVDYYTVFYTTLDRLLFTEVSPRLEKYKNYQDPLTYELYITFKDMAKMATKHVNTSERNSLQVLLFHEWFQGMPLNWIRMATKKATAKLKNAIRFDQQVDVDLKDDLRFSSSAVDVKSFLLQVGSFWKNLEWPVPEQAYAYLCTVVESISDLALHYVDSLYQSLLNEFSLLDENGRFRANERLCVVLNNMYHVRLTLQEIPQFLQLELYYTWLEVEEKLGDKARTLVNSFLDSSDEDIATKISYFLDKISDKLHPDIYNFLQGLFPPQPTRKRSITGMDLHSTAKSALQNIQRHLQKEPVTSEKLTNKEAVSPLMGYLSTNLQTLADYLLSPVLLGILERLWKVIMEMLSTRLAATPRKTASLPVYERFEYIIEQLRRFFYADGNGTSLDDLNTQEYQDLKTRLKYRTTDSSELVLTYCSELATHQESLMESESTPQGARGALHLSVGYLMDSNILEVTVIQGKDFAKDLKNGIYVELRLLPRWRFKECSRMTFKTSAEKDTTSPLYSKEFHIPASFESFGCKGGVLLLEVFHDQQELVGICAIDCGTVPRLFAHAYSLTNTDIPERKNLCLAVMAPIRTLALRELDERREEINDSVASDFLKANRKLFHNAL